MWNWDVQSGRVNWGLFHEESLLPACVGGTHTAQQREAGAL
jgi:hypothetical protein